MTGRRRFHSIFSPSKSIFSQLDIELIVFLLIFLKFSTIFRVLLRVRMLYYIKHEVVGDLVPKILEGVPIE